MTERKNIGWIKFVPSLDLPKERVSIAYDTHDERGIRYAYGYFQFYNGTCGCFWKDGNEQPKVAKAEDIKYWMPVPSLDAQEKPKECMYSKDDYTDDDRKALCEGCEEECKFNKKEEPASEELEKVVEEIVDPTVLNAYGVKEIANRLRRTMIESVSEEQVKESLIYKHDNKTCKENGNSLTQEPVSEVLEEAIDTYLATYFGGEKEKQEWPFLKKMAIHFANWQKKKDDYAIEIAHMAGEEEGKNIMKQQLMAKAVDATVHSDAGGYPYIPQMELYDYDKDFPLAKEGDNYKVILIKED